MTASWPGPATCRRPPLLRSPPRLAGARSGPPSASAPATPPGSPPAPCPDVVRNSSDLNRRVDPAALRAESKLESRGRAGLITATDAAPLRDFLERARAFRRRDSTLDRRRRDPGPRRQEPDSPGAAVGTLARGESLVRGALTSLDARSSARVLRQLGAEISTLRWGPRSPFAGGAGSLPRRASSTVATAARPPGSSSAPSRATPLRFTHRRRSLRRRPMRRVTEPLALMGARFTSGAATDRLRHDSRWPAQPARNGPCRFPAPRSRAALLLAGVDRRRRSDGVRTPRPLA